MANYVDEALRLLRKYSGSTKGQREWMVVKPRSERQAPLIIPGDEESVGFWRDSDYGRGMEIMGSGDEFANLHSHPTSGGQFAPSVPDLKFFLSNDLSGGNDLGLLPRPRPSLGTYGTLLERTDADIPSVVTVNPRTDDFPAMDEDFNDALMELYDRVLLRSHQQGTARSMGRHARTGEELFMPAVRDESAMNVGILNALAGKNALYYSIDNPPPSYDPMYALDLWQQIGGDAVLRPYCDGGYVDGE